jgi:hypothetical protein
MESTTTEDAVLVPDRAIGTDQTKKFVFVVGADGKPQFREVRLGALYDGMRVVQGDVKRGEHVVVEGLQRIQPGMTVAPQLLNVDAKGMPIFLPPVRRRGRAEAGRQELSPRHGRLSLLHRPAALRCRALDHDLPARPAVDLSPARLRVPEVAPPQVVVRAQFPGANPRVISETVATPLEEQINGVENPLYFDSQATADGSMTLTATFKIGTDPEVAETAVQNRSTGAAAPAGHRAPDRRHDREVEPEPDHGRALVSPTTATTRSTCATTASSTYATIAAHPGHGLGDPVRAGDYAMRIWIDPSKLAARSITSGEGVQAIREQNAQVAAGAVGAPPSPRGTEFQLSVNTQGRLVSEEQFADIIVRTDPATGGLIRIRDLGRVELSAGSYSLRSLLNNKEAAAIAVFQAPGSNALALSNNVRAAMERLKADFPQGMSYSIVYDPTRFVQTSIGRWSRRCSSRSRWS